MQKICISKDWLLSAPGTNGFVPVDLPNDYAVSQKRDPHAPGGGANGFYPCGTGRYLKYMSFPEDTEHVILDVDGAYMLTTMRVNDDQLVIHPHGYTPYLLDITDRIRRGHTNKLELKTQCLQPSTRWYSGAGVYRDVFLWTGGCVRVEPWDIFVKTKLQNDGTALVIAEYAVSSDIAGEAALTVSIADTTVPTTRCIPVTPGRKTWCSIVIPVKEPRLWNTTAPHLYSLHTEIAVSGKTTDTADTTFGIRTISADAQHGFLLNGEPMKLRGGCIHHDHGVLGAAAFPAAEERKLTRLKEAGFNALRIAHNPPSLALLEICDRIGMIVMDEAFDIWNCPNNDLDNHLWFADWWERDITAMVRRDRNHPCVISYSIGNEIVERNGTSDGALWARRLSEAIRKWDNTRFVTSAVCGMWERPEATDPEDYKKDFLRGHPDIGEGGLATSWADWTEEYMKPLDIVGYNYLFPRYEADHVRYPDRVIWGSETHTMTFYDSWKEVLKNPHVIGDFTWTAYDNMGETGTGRSLWARDGFIPGISLAGYPWRNCYQGDLDLCGYRRPQSYFREAVWIGGTEPKIFTTHPEHYGEDFSGTGWHWYDVLDTWTYPDAYIGKPTEVDVYTDADEIAWYKNGEFLGKSSPIAGIATMDIPYEPGEISVIAYKDGRVVGTSALHTVGEAAAVSLVPERAEFAADRRDLCYIDVTVTDKNGDRIPDAKTELTCTVDGGELMGIFSGDPANEDQFTSNVCHAFTGRALCIIRAAKPGKVTVTVAGEGLAPDTVTVTAE